VNNSVDLTALTVAVALLALVFWAAARTRSRLMRFTLVGFAAVVIALMLWNLAVRGGFHAV
jgi:putative flippase GtrA